MKRFLAVALLALLLVPAGAGAKRPPRSLFGINIGTYPTPKDATVMARGGVREARVPMLWPLIQPTPLAYSWAGFDTVVERFAERGIRVAPFAVQTPSWVAKNVSESPTSSAFGTTKWTQFLQTAVERYGHDGTFWATHPGVPYLPIEHWQIWNEPNFPAYWGNNPVSPAAYARLLQVSAQALRSADPTVRIVLAGLGPGLARKTQIPSWKFLRGLYGAGARRWFDVAADHPYGAGVQGVKYQLRRVAKVIRRHHDHAPLWVDEVGWSSGRYSQNRLAVGPRRQATLLRRTYRFVIRHRRGLHVTRLMWFDFRDHQDTNKPPGCPGCFAFGLRRYDGRAKPAWRAFRDFTRRR